MKPGATRKQIAYAKWLKSREPFPGELFERVVPFRFIKDAWYSGHLAGARAKKR